MTGVVYELDMREDELRGTLGNPLNIMTLNVGGRKIVPLVIGVNQYDGKGVYLSMESGDREYSGAVLEFLRKQTGRKINVVSETTMS